MNTASRNARNALLRSVPFAALLGCCLLAPPDAANAATRLVTNCNDDGTGSLRSAVAAAGSHDVIDLSALTCGQIDLRRAVDVPQDYLTFVGPGHPSLTLSGGGVASVLRHTGLGTVRIEKLTLANGRHTAVSAQGGCLYGRHLILKHSVVRNCRVETTDPLGGEADGGAIYARGNLGLYNSGVHDSSSPSRGSRGGGVYTGGRLTVDHSRLRDNQAFLGGGAYVRGNLVAAYASVTRNASDDAGGILVDGNARIDKSTFAGNASATSPGALRVYGLGENLITNSTFSSNISRRLGAMVLLGRTTIANSTIAYNREQETVNCEGAVEARYLHLESTIIARNTCGDGRAYDLGNYSELQGADNLIMRSLLGVPPDTITANPQLGPLVDNGGLTKTHALSETSPARDSGNNVLGLATDQRGRGFARTKGLGTDIGAYEF